MDDEGEETITGGDEEGGKDEDSEGEGKEKDAGEDGGNAFLDAMLDSVFGMPEEADGSGFSSDVSRVLFMVRMLSVDK